MADIELDSMEILARAAARGPWRRVVLALIDRVRAAEDERNVCARCGKAIDADRKTERLGSNPGARTTAH